MKYKDDFLSRLWFKHSLEIIVHTFINLVSRFVNKHKVPSTVPQSLIFRFLTKKKCQRYLNLAQIEYTI